MKYRYLKLCIVSLLPFLVNAEVIDMSSTVVMDDLEGEFVELFFQRSEEVKSSRQFWLEFTNEKTGAQRVEHVWDSSHRDDYSLYPTNYNRESEPYSGAEIICSTLENETLVLVLRLATSANGYKPVSPRMRGKADVYLNEWTGFDYILRSFTRSRLGEWNVGITVYLDTLWADVESRKIQSVIVEDEFSFKVRYVGTWVLQMYSEFEYETGYKHKVYHPSGFTEKKIVYDREQDLLYSVSNDLREYIIGSFWWRGFDEFELGGAGVSFTDIKNKHTETLRLFEVSGKQYEYIPTGRDGVLSTRRIRGDQ